MEPFNFWISLLTIAIVFGAIQGICAYQILLERKLSAWLQDRVGPNRVGPFGLLQPIADGIKFVLKEQVVPDHVDKLLYFLAPAVGLITAMLAFAVVPFGPTSKDPSAYQFVIAPGIDIGIVFVFAIGSLNVYAVVLGGWASNNKYSLLGSLRSSAQLVSYEIPMGMSILGVVLFAGSLNLEQIIHYQLAHGWNILYQPLAFLLFLISVFAECNRLPFDLPEAEQELVGGYHTEYSAWKFALFFLAEYTHMITTSFLLVILFLGGWHLPGLPETGMTSMALKVLVIVAKMGCFIFFYMWIRWTILRFRFDQLMSLAWQVMIPLGLLNLVCVMIVMEFPTVFPRWVLFPVTAALPIAFALFAGAGSDTGATPRTPALHQVEH